MPFLVSFWAEWFADVVGVRFSVYLIYFDPS